MGFKLVGAPAFASFLVVFLVLFRTDEGAPFADHPGPPLLLFAGTFVLNFLRWLNLGLTLFLAAAVPLAWVALTEIPLLLPFTLLTFLVLGFLGWGGARLLRWNLE